MSKRAEGLAMRVGEAMRVHASGIPEAEHLSSMTVEVLSTLAVRIDDVLVPIPGPAEQLVAFLAVHQGSWLRGYVAARLWVDQSEQRARANLRNAIWKLDQLCPGLLERSDDRLSLADRTQTDIALARSAIEALVGQSTGITDLVEYPPIHLLRQELLTGWYDDWVLPERERLKQLGMHALERVVEWHCQHGRWAAAIDAGLSGVALEPLRETAHRALVRAYVGEGNPALAWRQYDSYRSILADALGAAPSAAFTREIEMLLSRP